LLVRPYTGLFDCQSDSIWGTFVFAMTTAPAPCTRVVTGASCPDRKSFHVDMPAVVRSPRTLMDSFRVIGRPSSGASSPRARRVSAASASRRARSKSGSTIALSSELYRSIRRRCRSRRSTADTRRARSAASISVAVVKAWTRSLMSASLSRAAVSRHYRPHPAGSRIRASAHALGSALERGHERRERGRRDLLPGEIVRQARIDLGLDQHDLRDLVGARLELAVGGGMRAHEVDLAGEPLGAG